MSQLPPHERLRIALKQKSLDAFLITGRENTKYLSGFSGSDSTILIPVSKPDLYLFVDSRYTEQAKSQCPGWHVIEYKRAIPTVSKTIADLRLQKVAFESKIFSYNLYRKYMEELDKATLVPVEAIADKLRVVKSDGEIEKIKKAIQIAETAFENCIGSLKPGVSEIDWAMELEFAIRRAGGSRIAFDLIVASGENGAMPHARASHRKIRKGELVTIDFGAEFEFYNSDMTVTVAVGAVSKELSDIYQTVLDAHDMAIEAARAGLALKALDGVARKHIDKKGYGKYFGHGLGHGIGLAVHEEPSVSPLSDDALQDGTVVTIEPGIYIPGLGGARIEDMIRIKADGAELLTSIDKKLMVL